MTTGKNMTATEVLARTEEYSRRYAERGGEDEKNHSGRLVISPEIARNLKRKDYYAACSYLRKCARELRIQGPEYIGDKYVFFPFPADLGKQSDIDTQERK